MDENTNQPQAEAEPLSMHENRADLVELLSQKVVGQPSAMKFIVPYVYMWQAGLAPEGRPAGVFLLLGPTGTGKTRTVEAIAEVLHGDPRKIVKIDCGEFQMEHEVAKLLGAPPGYLGHRETLPILTQQQLMAATTEGCDLAIVLFDEIEKAAPSLSRLLLGILDKGAVRLGDNTPVNFEKSLIFFTSNLGAQEMMKEIGPGLGFQTSVPRNMEEVAGKLEHVALAAVRKRFSPEFVNRIDAVVTYQPLDEAALSKILDHHIAELQTHVNTRLGERCFDLSVSEDARALLLRKGTSAEYGARELKRTIHRELTQPLATMVATGQVGRGATLNVTLREDGDGLVLTPVGDGAFEPAALSHDKTLLIVDDNLDLLGFLKCLLEEEGWNLKTAASAHAARSAFLEMKPQTVLLDYLLGEEDGITLGLKLQKEAPRTQVIIMTGGNLTTDEEAVCRVCEFPILRKPFLAGDVLSLIRRGQRRTAVTATAVQTNN